MDLQLLQDQLHCCQGSDFAVTEAPVLVLKQQVLESSYWFDWATVLIRQNSAERKTSKGGNIKSTYLSCGAMVEINLYPRSCTALSFLKLLHSLEIATTV